MFESKFEIKQFPKNSQDYRHLDLECLQLLFHYVTRAWQISCVEIFKDGGLFMKGKNCHPPDSSIKLFQCTFAPSCRLIWPSSLICQPLVSLDSRATAPERRWSWVQSPDQDNCEGFFFFLQLRAALKWMTFFFMTRAHEKMKYLACFAIIQQGSS